MNHFDKLSENFYQSKKICLNSLHAPIYFGRRIDFIEKYVSLNKKGFRFLDIGCGEGSLLKMIQEKHPSLSLFGIDLSKKQIKRTKKRVKNAKLSIGNAQSTSFKNNYFDVVVSCALLHHTKNFSLVVKEMIRICKPDGWIFIFEPNHFSPLVFILALLKPHERGVLKLNSKKIETFLIQKKLVISEFARFNTFLFPFQTIPGKTLFPFFNWLENWRFFPSILKTHFVFVVKVNK